ncbi:RsmB/NOP family class I SAM-dependent RNA methyltransferase [uncultured Litoreibacter sp.]|uniref:RsmB/NOP family class I SAM-dependent RNA methyltransferase n=1 Tax=uncultured Litoreibacter sp. TaxID=1392394 RepID=UPI00262110F8|nr:RsmB/NOP family class I SAM-dependent RNA methyltransferase [uncultured Litoreibacter sp.]
MTPAARLSAAIEVLDIYLSGTAAEKALTNWARRSRFAGSKDRAAVRDIVFECLRKRGKFSRLGLTGRGLVVCYSADTVENPEELKALFSGEGHAPAGLTKDEHSALEQGENATSDEMLFNMPDWLSAELKASLGDDAIAVAQSLSDRAGVFVRVNTTKGSVDAALSSLAKDGIVARRHDLSKNALQLIENPRKLSGSAAYLSGLVELQDVASQALCAKLPSAKRMLDYCAGGGGKVLAYGDQNDALLFAHDANPKRLQDLGPRAKRAGVKVSILSSKACRQAAPFDLVLCDVPCSGSGAWRRSPEGKWSLSESAYERLLGVQQDILREAAGLVAVGGTLAFATCSVFTRENEEQIAKFCAENDGWTRAFDHRFSPLEGGDGFYLAYLTQDSRG